MKVSFYCQHVLGIGHFHRSLEICLALAVQHPTTLILGGPPVAFNPGKIKTFLLPGLEMNTEFQGLMSCDPSLTLEDVKWQRQQMLLGHLQDERPDILITELYPFGRKAFRFEIEPLLNGIRSGTLPPCLCCCSVRDILVEKTTGREKFEQRAVQTLNDHFDGILVHADREIISLGDTFQRLDDIRIPLHYTGFVTKTRGNNSSVSIRKELDLATTDKLIVASIGGGNVGSELLFAVQQAVALLSHGNRIHLQLFCGPYCNEQDYHLLQKNSHRAVTVDRFTDQFPAWLEAADLSISMAGYNTCMNLLQAGIPALVLPFRQNREQRLRAERIGRKAPIAILNEHLLAPAVLAERIEHQLLQTRQLPAINLHGAEETVRQLEKWYSDRK